MIVRRANWWIVLAIAVAGPLLGAAVTSGFSLKWTCDSSTSTSSETATSSRSHREARDRTNHSVELPDGERVGFRELAPGRAKAIVVMKGPWCDVCKRQLRALSERIHRVQMTDAAVYGLSAANPDVNRRLMGELGLNFPILSDADENLLRRLDLWMHDKEVAMPGVIYVDGEGEVTRIHRGRYPGKPQEACIMNQLERMD